MSPGTRGLCFVKSFPGGPSPGDLSNLMYFPRPFPGAGPSPVAGGLCSYEVIKIRFSTCPGALSRRFTLSLFRGNSHFRPCSRVLCPPVFRRGPPWGPSPLSVYLCGMPSFGVLVTEAVPGSFGVSGRGSLLSPGTNDVARDRGRDYIPPGIDGRRSSGVNIESKWTGMSPGDCPPLTVPIIGDCPPSVKGDCPL